MRWYEQMNFYYLNLSNKKTIEWWTPLKWNEAKEEIANNGFVLISSGRKEDYKEEEIHTKAVVSIHDMTQEKRTALQERDELIQRKLELVKQIRNKKQTYFAAMKVKSIDKHYQKNELTWYDRHLGVHIDPLLRYYEFELEKILRKSK